MGHTLLLSTLGQSKGKPCPSTAESLCTATLQQSSRETQFLLLPPEQQHRPLAGIGRPPLAFFACRTTDVSRWRAGGPGTNWPPPMS